MEEDAGFGVGGPDTPILAITGGAPDKVAASGWMSIEELATAPKKLVFGPTMTGARLSLELRVVRAPNARP